MPSAWTDYAEIQWPKVGDRVKYTTMTAKRGHLEQMSGESVVVSLGAGIAPHFTVEDGQHIHPTLGDTWEVIERQLDLLE